MRLSRMLQAFTLISFTALCLIIVSQASGQSANEYRVRIPIPNQESLAEADRVGIPGPSIGWNQYLLDGNTYRKLLSSGLDHTLLGGTTTVFIKPGETLGLPLPNADNSIVMPDSTTDLYSGNVYMYIPDATGWAVYYYFMATGAPADAVVTGLTYSTLVEDDWDSSFWCGDYIIALYSGTPAYEYIVWYNDGNWYTGTDGGYDDDSADDYDIYINNNTTSYFNGRSPNSEWGIVLYDSEYWDDGWMRYVKFTIDWEVPYSGTPDIRIDPSSLTFDIDPSSVGATGSGSQTTAPLAQTEDAEKEQIQASLVFDPEADFLPGKLFVRFKSSVEPAVVEANGTFTATNRPSVNSLLEKHSATVEKRLHRKGRNPEAENICLISFDSPRKMKDVLDEFIADPDVLYAEPIYKRHPCLTPTDSSFYQQWAYQNIQAEAAWDLETGDSSVVIAIIDTGVDWDHPDLAANIWQNSGEIEGNGIDDDGNGYIDDVRGWDTASNDNDPMDTYGHGSHCAGISAAVTNNTKTGTNVAGTAWNCLIMAVRAGDENGFYDSDIVEAIHYAIDNGADVISMSLGGPYPSTTIQTACNLAYNNGIVVVAAAGNDNSSAKSYPAAYSSVIAVAATDSADQRASFSNYGSWVQLAAPGVSILSTLWNNTYDSWSGTSMACPFVSGAAGLVLSLDPTLTNAEVSQILIDNTDNIDAINPGYAGQLGSGRLNLYRALSAVGGGGNPGEEVTAVLTVHNDGDGTLNVSSITRQSGKTWLKSALPSSFSVTPGSSANVTVTITTAGLAEGFSDTETLVIASNDPDEPSVEIPVTITFAGQQVAILDTAIQPGTGQVTLTFATVQGHTYGIFYSDGPYSQTMQWLPAVTGLDGQNGSTQWTDDGSATGGSPSAASQRYYMIEDTTGN